MPVRQMGGKIIGPKHCQHAVRLVADGHARAHIALKPALRSAFEIGGDRNLHLVNHGFGFGPRFPHGLAGFARDAIGKGLGPAPHDIGKAPQRFHPDGDGLRSPSNPVFAGGGHFGIHIAHRTTPIFSAGRWFERYDFGCGHALLH